MELDIQKLHDVIEGKVPNWRGMGFTTAVLVQAIQSAEVNSYNSKGCFAVIAPNYLMCDSMLHRAKCIAIDMGITAGFQPNRRILYIPGVFTNEIHFVNRVMLQKTMAGRRWLNYYIDNSMSPQLTYDEYNFLESRIERE